MVCKVIVDYGVFADKIMKKYDLIVDDDDNNTVEIVYKKTPQNNRILKMILGSLSIIVFGGLAYKKFNKNYNYNKNCNICLNNDTSNEKI